MFMHRNPGHARTRWLACLVSALALIGIAGQLLPGSAASASEGATSLSSSAITSTATAGTSAVLTVSASSGTPMLPFDMPSVSVLRSSPRLVFAHYWPPLPVSLDNQSPSLDYYARNYLTPDGEGGKHAAYGGYLRDRPLTRSPLTGSDWRAQDMRTEVRQAIAGGLDGFTLDIIQLADGSDAKLWQNVVLMMQAAHAVDPGFKIMLMPDMGGSLAGKDVATFSRAMAELAKSPAAYRLSDGRLVVSPFMAEAHPASWWKSFQDTMKASYGISVALLPTFVGNEQTYASSFAPISYGMSIWGARNPAWNDPTLTYSTSPRGRAASIKARGMKWMQPVSVQDERPDQGVFDEARNTENLRDSWELARDTQAEFVQIPTWNDYSEGTQLAPSAKHGWTFLDLSSYYLTWYKIGTAPKIVRDTIYLTHRTQPAAAKPSYPQTKLMTVRGGSAPVDSVEALTFLTAPADVVINVGTHNYRCAAQAGVDTCTVPLGPGRISAWVARNGSTVAGVTSGASVTSKPLVQDLQYVGVSSGRTPSDGGNDTAATVTTDVNRTVSLLPTSDGYVNAGAPSNNYGSTSSLSSQGDTAAIAYLRYDVPLPPSGTTLTSAALRIRTASTSEAGSADPQSVYVTSDSWSESSLDWNNRPASTGSAVAGLGGGPRINTSYTLPLSLSAAKTFPGNRRTLSVRSAGRDELRFWSREYADWTQQPTLVLTYTPTS